MTVTQKVAWFNLAIVAATVVLVFALVPVLGPRRAQGGFGLLGLLGLSVLFYRRRGTDVVEDERDQAIRRRSALIAYSVFWLVFVGTCVSLPMFYGGEGSVPVSVVQLSVWYGLILFVGVISVATLVQYQLGGGDAV